jgi:hypothetical protein
MINRSIAEHALPHTDRSGRSWRVRAVRPWGTRVASAHRGQGAWQNLNEGAG